MGWIAFAFALFAGALITGQTGSNSQLKKSLGQPLPALIVNYIVGVGVVFIYALLRRVPVPTLGQAGGTPWWGWAGGLFGAVYGLAAILLASQMGAATLTALVVTGQLVCAVALDHFGWLGFEIHPAGIGRLLGCGLMVLGLILIAKF
jgi:bacterial/archaeal transporter family-2 protein